MWIGFQNSRNCRNQHLSPGNARFQPERNAVIGRGLSECGLKHFLCRLIGRNEIDDGDAVVENADLGDQQVDPGRNLGAGENGLHSSGQIFRAVLVIGVDAPDRIFSSSAFIFLIVVEENLLGSVCISLSGIFINNTPFQGASLMAQLVKNLPAMQKTWVQSLGWQDPLEKGMATHCSILAWKIP